MSKLFVIEGTDCSGKETQTKLLKTNLEKKGYKVFTMSFPKYDTPTGKIIGGPYLGKKEITEGWFKEGASNVDPYVASLYFAADRYYNKTIIEEKLNSGYIVLLDRYITSNMAHQGSKYKNKVDRLKIYNDLSTLEHNILSLPKENKVFFLHVPFKHANEFRKTRKDFDEHELDLEYIKNSEKAYLELTELYNFKIINCIKDDKIKTIEEINKDLLESVLQELDEVRRI